MKRSFPGNSRGSILLAALIMMVIAGTSVLVVTTATTGDLRSAKRSFDRTQAFYAAESGVERVLHWFNNPDEAPADLTVRIVDEDGNLTNELFDPDTGLSTIQQTWTANPQDLDVIIRGSDSFEIAEVIDLRVEPPGGGAGNVARVISTARTRSNVEATVEVQLRAPNPRPLLIPAALMTDGVAASMGHFDVRWGEVWALDDINAPQNWNRWAIQGPSYSAPRGGRPGTDPWFFVKTESWIRDHNGAGYADGRQRSDFSDSPVSSGSPNHEVPYLASQLNRRSSMQNRENILQQQDLDWPDFSYDTIKQLVLDNGFGYYRMTENGMIIDPSDGRAKTFQYMFSRATGLDPGDTHADITPTDPDAIDRDEMPPVIFIDTPDGRHPDDWKAEGRLPEIGIQGQNEFYYGLFFMASDLTINGTGGGERLDNPTRPDDAVDDPIDIMTMGFMGSYGTMRVTGNPGVYGAVYAEEGFDGGGTWNIWYDNRLNNVNRQNIDKTVRVALWDAY